MRFHAHGVRFFPFYVHHFTNLILHTLEEAFGASGVIALLRVTVGAATFVSLATLARVMWVLPATADALIAGITAISWTLWLDRKEGQ